MPNTPEEAIVQGQEQQEISESDISSAEADNLTYEQSSERKDDILHAEQSSELDAMKESYAEPPSDDGSHAQAPVVSKDEVVIEVEKILEDGIGAFYASLPDEAKPAFKQKGEEAANEISEMVRTLSYKVKRLIGIISDWLKTIPGVNKYFLEQEAKIKADRIIELIEARKEDQI